MILFKRIKMGFTLAEVLVTLGIIGVVSVLTMPVLLQNYQQKVYIGRLHSFYSLLSQALLNYQTEHNAVNLIEAGINSQDITNSFINDTFKIVKICQNSLTPCFASSYKSIKGNKISGFDVVTSFVLANGTAVRPKYYGNQYNNAFINILIDTNGTKGPNIHGRDLFNIGVYSNGLIDDIDHLSKNTAPLSKERREELFNSKCLSNSTYVYGCFGKILNDNWEMNY